MIHLFTKDSTLGLLFGYDLFVNAVMAALVVLSVLSWAIILHKSRLVRRIRHADRAFHERFAQRVPFADLVQQGDPAALGHTVIREGLVAAKRFAPPEAPEKVPVEALPAVQAVVARTIGLQVEQLNARLAVLATVSSIAPLIGLLGTVWGIMVAFLDIKNYGSTNINVVAPGIAEALVTTIAGLVVAIPAVVAYNALAAAIRELVSQQDALGAEFVEELRAKALLAGKAH
jgi:biopolymer transport protein TolQ